MYRRTGYDETGHHEGNGQQMSVDPMRIMTFCTAVQKSAQLLNRCNAGDPQACAEVRNLSERAQAGEPSARRAMKILHKCSQWGNLKNAGMGYEGIEVAGFWGDLWSGVKSVAGAVPGVGNTIQKGMEAAEKAADLVAKVNGGNKSAIDTVKSIVSNANAGSAVAKQAVSTLSGMSQVAKTGGMIPTSAVTQLANAFSKPVPPPTTVAYPPQGGGKEGFHRILLPDGRVVDVSGGWASGKGTGEEVAGFFFNRPATAKLKKGSLEEKHVLGFAILLENAKAKRKSLRDAIGQKK
jgi:hypothetical protein